MGVNYGSSTVRRRRTKAELSEVDEAIVEAVRTEHPVSLRGVYYRVVSMGAVEKTELGYRLVGRQLLALRRAGTVPYSHITDGTRWLRKVQSWSSVDQVLDDAAASYRRALWHDQDAEVMVLVEKDAISGVVAPITSRWDVPLGVLRGYSSESYAWSVAQHVGEKRTFIYQLGDHDPSGIDAWRAFRERVLEFLADHGLGENVVFERLAVTQEQIVLMGLPTRPTKTTDSRSGKFDGESVEVDAIPPTVLRQMIERAIERHIDDEALRLTQIAEQSERLLLYSMKGRLR